MAGLSDGDGLRRRRAEVVARHGPWIANNIHLGHGVYTVRRGAVWAGEQRVARTLQLVQDAAGPIEGLSVLDLGSYEGAMAVEFALHGATVVGIEAREPHIEKARFAARELGLTDLRFVQADIRELVDLDLGTFDVVLCLGVFYHLPSADLRPFFDSIAGATRRMAVLEGQVALRATNDFEHKGSVYSGRPYPEDSREPGAALDDRPSFWLTRPSLLNMLGHTGFTSVLEARSPSVPEADRFRDHVTLVAYRGEGAELRSVPDASGQQLRPPIPERARTVAHPSQGLRYRLAERCLRWRGGGLTEMFRPHQAASERHDADSEGS